MWENSPDEFFISNLNLPFLSREILKSFDIVFLEEKSYLIIVAFDRNNKKNQLVKISCKKGIPIPGLAYDNQSDSYLISCVSHFELGCIPFSIKMVQKNNLNWKISLPLPEKTIKRFISTSQKKSLKNFMSQFEDENIDFKFIQFTDAN